MNVIHVVTALGFGWNSIPSPRKGMSLKLTLTVPQGVTETKA